MERERADEPHVLPVALTLALCAHVGIAYFTPIEASEPEPPLAPLEVELGPPKAAPPPPEPPPPPAVAEASLRAARTVRAARAQAPAAGGNLLTAEPSAAADAPLDFVTDPNGAGSGFGVVSRRGTSPGEGAHGKDPVRVAAVAAPSPPPLAAPADLVEKPHLLVEDPCRGFYPANASVDSAAAVVRVVLEPNGRVRDVTLLSEAPPGEGFGTAARQCIRQQRFSSARDHEGRTVATATTIRVRFER
jgi:TonB family protein